MTPADTRPPCPLWHFPTRKLEFYMELVQNFKSNLFENKKNFIEVTREKYSFPTTYYWNEISKVFLEFGLTFVKNEVNIKFGNLYFS